MWQKSSLRLTILMMCLLTACTASGSPTADPATAVPEQGEVLVIGDISDEPAETINGTQPIADYLAAQLAEEGVIAGEVKVAPDMETMIQLIEDGQVDLYFDSPYPIMVISGQTGATPILRRFRFGVEEYNSVFITRKDSDLASLEDLRGQMVAFEENFSTSGFMLPLTHLMQNDLNPVEKASPEVEVAADEVGYVFSTADDSTIQWVISGLVPAGVIDNVTFSRLPEETQAELKIIAETEFVPRQLVLVRPDMDTSLVEAIRAELLVMEESEEGQAMLEQFQTTEFAEFEDGAEAALARMRELYEMVQGGSEQ